MCYVFTVLIEKARSFLPAQYKSTPGGKAYAATDDEYEQSTGCSDVPIINEHLQGINSSSHLQGIQTYWQCMTRRCLLMTKFGVVEKEC
jgi:hypothetical protein